jgi:hypothetical protein
VRPVRSIAAALVAVIVVFLGAGCSRSHSVADDKGPVNSRCESSISPSTSLVTVRLSDVEPQPIVRIRVGDEVRAVATANGTQTTTPLAFPAGVLCEKSTVHTDGSTTTTFVAVSAGKTSVSATITGVPGGLNHPNFGATVVVNS